MNWGRSKVIFERARNYVGIGTQIGSFVILLVMNHISFWWVLLGIVLFVLFLWRIDLKRIYPAELEYGSTMNPEWVKLMKKVEELLENKKL